MNDKQAEKHRHEYMVVAISFLTAIIVAVVGGYFTVKSTIEAVKLSNESNQNIATKNIEALIESVKLSSKNNLLVASKNNSSLLESVKETNANNAEIAKINNEVLIQSIRLAIENNVRLSEISFDNTIKQISQQNKYQEDEKNKQYIKHKQENINILLSDITSRMINLAEIKSKLKIYRKQTESVNFESTNYFFYYVILSNLNTFKNEIDSLVNPLNTNIINFYSKIDNMSYKSSSSILIFFRKLEVIKSLIDKIKVYKTNYSYKEDHNNEYFYSSYPIKDRISAAISEMVRRNNVIVSIMNEVNAAFIHGNNAMITLLKEKGEDTSEYEKYTRKALSSISYDYNDNSFYPEELLNKARMLKKQK